MSEAIEKKIEEQQVDDERLFGSYVDLRIFADYFWKMRWAMLLVLVISISIGQIYLLVAQKKYSAEVTIAEKGAQGSSASLGGNSGVLAKLLTAKSESSGALSLTYAVRSTAVAERVVKAEDLQNEWLKNRIDKKDYNKMTPEDRFLTAVSLVRTEVEASSDRQNPGLIKVSITDKEPEVAYKLLRLFLIELQYVMSATDLIFNKRLRLFFEDRMNVIDNRLLAFGSEIARLYGMNKLTNDKSTFSHENLPVENYDADDFKFDVSSLDFLSKIHDDVRAQVRGVQDPEKLSKKIDVPQQVYLTFLEDKYNMLRALRGVLANQHETALIGEKRNEQRFVVIEAPLLPKKPSKPKRFLVTTISFFGGMFLAFWFSIIYYFVSAIRQKFSPSS